MKNTIDLWIEHYGIEIGVTAEYDFDPREPQTYWSPGFAPAVAIYKVSFGLQDITEVLSESQMAELTRSLWDEINKQEE